MMENKFLSSDEVVSLTGFKQLKKQKLTLKNMNIKFKILNNKIEKKEKILVDRGDVRKVFGDNFNFYGDKQNGFNE